MRAREKQSCWLSKCVADLVLIDEYHGRTLALERGLPVSGTLGVIERADTVGILSDLPGTIQDLKKSGFYISESLEREMLNRHRIRKDRRRA